MNPYIIMHVLDVDPPLRRSNLEGVSFRTAYTEEEAVTVARGMALTGGHGPVVVFKPVQFVSAVSTVVPAKVKDNPHV